MKTILIAMLNVDLWIFVITARFLRKFCRQFKPFFEALFIMSLGAGLLLAYGMINMPDNNDFIRLKSKIPKERAMTIADTQSDSHRYLIERELIRLKNKALTMEMSLKRMNLQLQKFCKHERPREDLPDFASEAAGGSVIGTPNTESFYQPNQIQATLFGIPIWKPNYFTPRKIIQPWTQAGECWAFRGDSGNVEIELAHLALVDSVTLEHIPVSASLTRSIDSAPKEFRILGKFRNKYLLLGQFVYNYHGTASQNFHIDNEELKNVPLKIVMLQVFSNWGHPDYTCIYRFKVHGKVYNQLDDSLSYKNKK